VDTINVSGRHAHNLDRAAPPMLDLNVVRVKERHVPHFTSVGTQVLELFSKN